MKKGFKIAFIVVFFVLCALPMLLMPFFKNDTVQLEKRQPNAFPAYVQEGKLNVDFSDGFEKWLNDRIPFRAEMLSGVNFLKGELLHAGTSNVIVGKKGWLYYNAEGDDYMDLTAMTDNQIKALAVTLSLIEENVTSRGGAFTFVPVPNKASVYGEYMPGYYAAAKENNLTRVTEKLREYGVNFTDMQRILTDAKADGDVYHRLDSHWNYRGALIGYNAILDSLGKDHETWSDAAYTLEKTWRGDLDKLLYPAGNRLDYQYNYEIDFAEFRFTEPKGVSDTAAQLENFMSDKEERDAVFATKNLERTDGSTLYVVRDSFGRALLPYLIDSYENVTFRRTDTPDLVTLADGTDLVYEIVERNLSRVIGSVPFMYAPVREGLTAEGKTDGGSAAVGTEDAGFGYRIYGSLPEDADTGDGRVYLLLEQDGETVAVEAFPIYEKDRLGTEGTNGFSAILNAKELGLSGEYKLTVIVGGAAYYGSIVYVAE